MRVLLPVFVAVALDAAPCSLAAQGTMTDTTARAGMEREDSLRLQRRLSAATALGVVIPGAGLAYAGRVFPAYATFVGSLGSITYGVLFIAMGDCPLDLSNTCRPNQARRALGAGAGVALIGFGLWAWRAGVVQARREIRKQEERRRARRRRRAQSDPDFFVAPPVTPAGSWLVGMRATW